MSLIWKIPVCIILGLAMWLSSPQRMIKAIDRMFDEDSFAAHILYYSAITLSVIGLVRLIGTN